MTTILLSVGIKYHAQCPGNSFISLHRFLQVATVVRLIPDLTINFHSFADPADIDYFSQLVLRQRRDDEPPR